MKNQHIKYSKREDGHLDLNYCDFGLNCQLCSEIMIEIDRKSLTKWTKEVFGSGKLYVSSLSLGLSSLSLKRYRPIFDRLQNTSKKILEKFGIKGVIIRQDLEEGGPKFTLFIVFDRKIYLSHLRNAFQNNIDEPGSKWEEKFFGRIGALDFFNWAIPHRLSSKELDHLRQLSPDHPLVELMISRVSIID